MSDDELRDFISQPAFAAGQEKAKAPPATPVDTTMGMSGPELFMAGMGKRAMQIPRGVKELAIGAFGSPEALAEYNKEKAEQQRIDKMLMGNVEAQVGAPVLDVATAGLLPAKLLPQVIAAAGGAAVSPTQGPIKGMELPTRVAQGATAAAPTYAVGKGIGLLGKLGGAATGRYTPEGVEALKLNEAAKRLGVNRSVASLDPSSGLAGFETSLPGYARTVEQQVKDFTKAAKETKQIPSSTGKSFTDRTLEGEKLRTAIEEAGQNLQKQGQSLWGDLDSYILQNNIAPVTAKNTHLRGAEVLVKYSPTKKGQLVVEKNPIYQRIEEADPEAAQMLVQFMADAKTHPQVAFGDLHKVQAAVGKALARAEKDAGVPGASTIDRQAKRELKNLYGSMMSDVDAWGTKVPEAKQLYDDARTFWRDAVVPGAISNKVYNKAARGSYGMNPRGYQEPSQLYSDVVKNQRAMGELFPYMSQQGQDLTQTLQTMPDVSRALISGQPHPAPPGMGTVTTAAGMLVGSPLQLMKGAISNAPILKDLAGSEAAKKLYFSRDILEGTPVGQAAYGLGQIPEESAESGLEKLWSGR